MPKSVCQTSPGLAAGIFGLHPIHFLKSLERGLVQKLRGVFFLQFAEPASDGPSLVLGEVGQLCDDFRCAHEHTIAGSVGEGNCKDGQT